MQQKNNIKRRNFIRLSAAGTAGMLLAPTVSQGSFADYNGRNPAVNKVIYRTLGKTGIKVPIISSGKVPVDNEKLTRAILDSGILHIDTAHSYHDGRNEEALGKVLKDHNRKNFTIATKIKGPRDMDTGLFKEEATTEGFIKQFETSLERLGTNYVDILYLHGISAREAVLYEPALKALKTIKKQGKARFLGVSTHRNEPEVIQAAIDSNFYDIVLTAYNYQQNEIVDVKSAVKKAADAGLGVIAMKVMAGKDFHGKENKKPTNPIAALKWVLQDTNIHTAVLTFKTFDQLNKYFSVMENIGFTDQEKSDIETDNTSGSIYCPGCGKCKDRCRAHLPVPDIMRAYMYLYGYRDLAMARELIVSLNLPDNICNDCIDCPVECIKKYDVKRKIMDVVRIKNIPKEFLI